MPVSSSTEHWIKPDALTINLNHFGDPDYLQVSVLAGAVVMAFKQDVIGYNAAHNYRTWPLEAANTYLETSSAYNVYARLTRSEVNARALIVYDTVLRDIEGREITYAEDGAEILGDASADYFFVFLGQVSSNIDSNGQIIQREWIVDPNFGNLDTNQQKNDTVGLFDLMFKPHYDNPLDPNEITWIEALTHLGVAGGVTMYTNGGKLNIPSIYDGLPIDRKTLIRDENGVLMVNPEIELGGGVSNFWDLSGIPSWITNTKPIYDYSEIKGTPVLSVYALTSDLAKYVTLAGDETITGLKNFTKGLQIDGLGITKSQDDVIYLDANLVVRGGITMYSDNTVDVGTIFDALPIDGNTIFWENGVLKANITEGVITNITSDMVVEALGFTPYDVSNPKGYISGITSAMVVSALGYTPLQNHQTIYALTIQKNGTNIGTYTPNSAKKTINIVVPTKVSELDNDEEYATTGDLDSRINNLINGAPAAFDTLKEIADVLQGNVNSIGDIITTLGTKADKATTLAGYGITDAYTKVEANALYDKYLLLTGGTLSGDLILKSSTTSGNTPKIIFQRGTTSATYYDSYIYNTGGSVTFGITYRDTNYDRIQIGDKFIRSTSNNSYAIGTDALRFSNVYSVLGNYSGEVSMQSANVNGGKITYDSTNKYFKLEGDLIVTGGVTMFASDSSFTPSTIMDAIATDGVNLKVVNGVLTFVGSIDGGEAGSVAWENVMGKPSWIGPTKPSYSYSEISGTPTLLSSFNNDVGFVTSSALDGYLPLSGGKLKTNTSSIVLTLDASSMGDKNYLQFYNSYYSLGCLGFSAKDNPVYRTSSGTNYGLYHTGNFTPSDYLLASTYTASDILTKLLTVDGADSGLDADLLDGVERDSILELKQKGTARISAAGWYRIAKFQKTSSQSNVCRLHLSRNYNTLNNEAYIFDITYTHNNRYSITQTTGVYVSASSQCLTKIRIDSVSSTSEYAYVDFYYSKESANNVYWLSIGSLESFREPTLVEAPTGTPIEFETTKGCKSALGFEGSLTGNASTATQLQTPRTIWGQSFDGSGDVSGNLTVGDGDIYLNNDRIIRAYPTSGGSINVLHFSSSNTFILGKGVASKGYNTYLDGYSVRLRSGTSASTGLMLNSVGNVLIGTTTNDGYKLDVNGTLRATGDTTLASKLTLNGIPIYKSQDDVLYIDGNLAVRGGITMYATDAIDVPSIIDALPIASASAKGIAAFNPNDFSVVDGYVSFIGKGGVDESVLADYAKKTDLSAYLSLSGGQMTGSISYPLEYMGNTRDLASSCVFDYTDSTTAKGAIDNKRSLMGYAHNVTYDSWWNIISVRGDSDKYGMYICSSMTEYGGSLYWNRQEGFEGAWQGERVILDSVNWKDYVTTGNGGISGNVLTVDGSDYRGGYPALRMHIPNVNWQQFMMRGDGIVELRYGDGGQNNRWGQLALGTIFLDDQRDDVLYFPGKEYFDNHGNIHIPNADGSWSWNIFNSNGSSVMTVHTNGNVLVAGGITMYSDIRKKTKLQDVELSLKQIADAPLIEHYYNSDEKRTTHVGSIAQYWAGINDWFCKLDSEGYYTMEIQNAALASAISIARELVKYESKTDRKIRLLKQRVKELEEKIEKLENN